MLMIIKVPAAEGRGITRHGNRHIDLLATSVVDKPGLHSPRLVTTRFADVSSTAAPVLSWVQWDNPWAVAQYSGECALAPGRMPTLLRRSYPSEPSPGIATVPGSSLRKH
jgi:hypothetical protein